MKITPIWNMRYLHSICFKTYLNTETMKITPIWNMQHLVSKYRAQNLICNLVRVLLKFLKMFWFRAFSNSLYQGLLLSFDFFCSLKRLILPVAIFRLRDVLNLSFREEAPWNRGWSWSTKNPLLIQSRY